jgi:hypothetical protein
MPRIKKYKGFKELATKSEMDMDEALKVIDTADNFKTFLEEEKRRNEDILSLLKDKDKELYNKRVDILTTIEIEEEKRYSLLKDNKDDIMKLNDRIQQVRGTIRHLEELIRFYN